MHKIQDVWMCVTPGRRCQSGTNNISWPNGPRNVWEASLQATNLLENKPFRKHRDRRVCITTLWSFDMSWVPFVKVSCIGRSFSKVLVKVFATHQDAQSTHGKFELDKTLFKRIWVLMVPNFWRHATTLLCLCSNPWPCWPLTSWDDFFDELLWSAQ